MKAIEAVRRIVVNDPRPRDVADSWVFCLWFWLCRAVGPEWITGWRLEYEANRSAREADLRGRIARLAAAHTAATALAAVAERLVQFVPEIPQSAEETLEYTVSELDKALAAYEKAIG